MRLIASVIALAMLATLVGCSTATDPGTPTIELELISTVTQGELTINLFAEQELEAGYNPVHLEIIRSDVLIDDADVTIDPLMDMGMMKHSCPVTQPGVNAISQGMYEGAVIFTMAGTQDQWSLMIRIHNRTNGTTDSLRLRVNVNATSNVQMIRHEGQERTVATLATKNWRVGVNDV